MGGTLSGLPGMGDVARGNGGIKRTTQRPEQLPTAASFKSSEKLMRPCEPVREWLSLIVCWAAEL